MDKALVLADRLKKLKDQVDSLATKQTEIQTIKGDQGPKGDQGDRGFDGAPGLDGRDGKNGTDGADGKDGVSVIKAEIVFDGSLVLYLSNGDQIDCGEVTPAKSKEVFQTIKNSGGSSPIDIFTSLLPGLVPASGGGTVNFLRADGTFAAPLATTPAGSTTQIQFNNAGAFGASSNFTYDTGTNTLTVGPAGAETIIETLAPAGATVAGSLRIRGKNASATNGDGGVIRYTGGNGLGTGTGGGHLFTCGSGTTGGGISFVSANGTLDGGFMSFNSGAGGAGGTGGDFSMNAGIGNSTGNGGSFQLTAGNAASSGGGGGFAMLAGASVTGLGGDVIIASGFGIPSGSIYLGADSGTVIQVTQDATPTLQLGFYGVTPVAKPAPTASGTGNVLSSVVTALNSLGLVDSAALTNATANFTSVAQGLVPASGGGTTNFLRADGTFAAPSGGGGSFTTGTATLDFGSGLGANEASVAVTGQTSILSTSTVTLTVKNDATSTSHTANDHSYFLALSSLNSDTPIAGTGFTIKSRSIHKLTGTWTVSWSWL